MRRNSFLAFLLIVFLSACVDRIYFDIDVPTDYAIVIQGYISDEPGPYTVSINKAFDIESKLSPKTPLSVKRIDISDNLGNKEELIRVSDGVYQTNPFGIQGVIGRAYKIKIELLDGKIYESKPDTLYPSGKVSDVYFKFSEVKDLAGASSYGFDVYFNSTAGSANNYYYLWKFKGTFQYETNPELYTEPCGESRCPKPLPCSAFAVNSQGQLEEVRPCTCCTCWAPIFNELPLVSDNQFVNGGKFNNIKIANVPLTQWTFQHKVHAEVQQFSLSPNAFAFWKAVKEQKEANGSLFQPIAGRIPSNFVQISGATRPIEGLFYATSIVKNSVFINRGDIPNPQLIPPVNPGYNDTCLKLFPYSTNVKPSFWLD